MVLGMGIEKGYEWRYGYGKSAAKNKRRIRLLLRPEA